MMLINVPLKYLIPIISLSIGILLSVLYSWNNASQRFEQVKKDELNKSRIIGSRIANEIEKKQLYQHNNRGELTRLISYYVVDNLSDVEIIDKNNHLVFKTPPIGQRIFLTRPYQKKQVLDNLKINRIVHQFYLTNFNHKNIFFEDSNHIIHLFLPIKMSAQTDNILSRHQGALFLSFDISDQYHDVKHLVFTSSIKFIFIMALITFVLYLLIYYLVIKKLILLDNTAQKIKNGDYSIRMKVSGNNEISAVMSTLNSMASQIEQHHKKMQDTVKEAVEEKDKQQNILLMQSRFAAMGEMIGNIAHQWRQPLNALSLVIGNIADAQRFNKLDESFIKKSTTKSYKLINKMSTTIDDFRNFFEPDKIKTDFNINTTVNDTLLLLDETFKYHQINIEKKLVEDTINIHSYANEFSHVVLNLLNNSKDALLTKQIAYPKIIIDCYDKNNAVFLSIKDNAGGIDSDIIDKIFEPYFTTKDQGQGTGIGLYMSKIIIEEHMDGEIIVENTSDGVQFIVSLPLASSLATDINKEL